MASHVLAAVHLSNIYTASQTISVPTIQAGLSLLDDVEATDAELGHATAATSLYTPQAGRILARVINDRRTVELTQASDDYVPIRFLLPSRLVGTPGLVFEDASSSLHVLLLTETKSLYRLSFSLPRLFNSSPLPRNWCKEYVVKHVLEESNCPIGVVDAATVLVGLKDGGLLKLEQTRMAKPETVDGLTSFYDGNWKETAIRPSSLYNALTAFIPFTSGSSYDNPAHVLSVDSFESGDLAGFAFSISRDRRLRIWSLPQNACLRTEELPPSISSSSKVVSITHASPSKRQHIPLLPTEPRRLLRAIPSSTTRGSRRVLVFIPTISAPDSGGFFMLYDLHTEHSYLRNLTLVGQKACSEASAGCDLRDFIVCNGRIWALWDQQGRSLLESTPLDFNEFAQSRPASRWTVVVMPEEPDLSSDKFTTPDMDVPESETSSSLTVMYTTALMTPELFSPLTLKAGLKEYQDHVSSEIEEHPPLALTARYDSTTEGIAAVVGCTVTLERDVETGVLRWDAHHEALQKEWERFVTICIELERAARWPLTLTLGKGEEVIVQDRERIGVVVEAEEGGSTTPVFGEEKVLLHLAQSLASTVGPAVLADFTEEVVAAVRSPLESSAEDICFAIYEQTLRSELAVRANELAGQLPEPDHLASAVNSILQKLARTTSYAEHEPSQEGEVYNGFVTSYICTLSKTRYDISLSLLLLLVFVSAEIPEALKDATGLLSDALTTFHSTSTLWYLCRQPGGNPLRKTGSAGVEEDFAARFGKLQVALEKGGSSLRKNIDYCLVHSLLSETPECSDVRSSALDFMESSGLLEPRREIAALPGDAMFLNQLRQKGHLALVVEVVGWYPRSPAMSFVLGRSLLDLKRGDDAAPELYGAATVFEEDSTASLIDKQALLKVFPVPELQATPSFIYQQIASWYEHAGFLSIAVTFWKRAIEAPVSRADLAHLWYKISAAQIELGLFDDAYSTLMATPYREQQDHTLRKLVDVMCSSGEADKLVRMSFSGLQANVEEILDFKARNQDPLQPPDYSSILYSWYVFRGNYRSAGAAMYHHARRLGALSNPKLDYRSVTVNQAHAYLAAINCLSLVEPRNAWIITTVADSDAVGYRPAMTHYIPNDRFAPDSKVRELTQLEDVRREYALALARLELLQNFQQLGTTSITLSPQDAVAAFAQFGMYDSAFTAAASLDVDMMGLFSDLATKCASIPSYTAAYTMEVAPWLETASERIGSWDGTMAEKALRYLRESLERHDSPDTAYQYHKVVLEAILKYNRHNRIPNWLAKFFEEHNPEYLIRLFLRYGLVLEAATYTISMIRRSNAKLTLIPGVSETWLPYHLIQSVIDLARKSDEGKTRAVASSVETIMNARIREMENRSRLAAQKLVDM